jgi:hypothetical protein
MFRRLARPAVVGSEQLLGRIRRRLRKGRVLSSVLGGAFYRLRSEFQGAVDRQIAAMNPRTTPSKHTALQTPGEARTDPSTTAGTIAPAAGRGLPRYPSRPRVVGSGWAGPFCTGPGTGVRVGSPEELRSFTDPEPPPEELPVPFPDEFPVPFPDELPVPFPEELPVPFPDDLPVPFPDELPVPFPDELPVPFPEELPVPFPDELPVPFPDELPVPFPDELPVPFPEELPVPFPEEFPVPLPVPFPEEFPVPLPVPFPDELPPPEWRGE